MRPTSTLGGGSSTANPNGNANNSVGSNANNAPSGTITQRTPGTLTSPAQSITNPNTTGTPSFTPPRPIASPGNTTGSTFNTPTVNTNTALTPAPQPAPAPASSPAAPSQPPAAWNVPNWNWNQVSQLYGANPLSLLSRSGATGPSWGDSLNNINTNRAALGSGFANNRFGAAGQFDPTITSSTAIPTTGNLASLGSSNFGGNLNSVMGLMNLLGMGGATRSNNYSV